MASVISRNVAFIIALAISLAMHVQSAAAAGKTGFTGISATPLSLEPHGPDRCDLWFFRAKTTDSAFDGLSGDFHGASFPQEQEIDAAMSRYVDCGTPYFEYSIMDGALQRVFPGRKPYFLDPFVSGPAQNQLASTPENYDNISFDDALTEHEIWRLISAVNLFKSVSSYNTRLNKEGIRFAKIRGYQSAPTPPGFSQPDAKQLDFAYKVALGARVRVMRAILWQYQKMDDDPYFAADKCAAYGSAFTAIRTIGSIGPSSPAYGRAYDTLGRAEEQFYYKALPFARASFGQIAPITQSWQQIGDTLHQKVYRETKNYECLTDGPGFVQNVANQRFREISDTKVAAEMAAVQAGIERRANSAKAAALRNSRAASGDFAPVADDIVRAIINARRDANAPNLTRASALVGKGVFYDQLDYEDGLYIEDYIVQKNAIQHFVEAPNCTRVSKLPVVYDCAYNVRHDIFVTIFGMSLPKLSTSFSPQRHRFEFANGNWNSAALRDAYRAQREKMAATLPSYDPSKSRKEFYCISTRNFADRFGLVSDC